MWKEERRRDEATEASKRETPDPKRIPWSKTHPWLAPGLVHNISARNASSVLKHVPGPKHVFARRPNRLICLDLSLSLYIYIYIYREREGYYTLSLIQDNISSRSGPSKSICGFTLHADPLELLFRQH